MSVNKQQNLINDCLDERSRQEAETGEIENRPETDNLLFRFQDRCKDVTVPGKVSKLIIYLPIPHQNRLLSLVIPSRNIKHERNVKRDRN